MCKEKILSQEQIEDLVKVFTETLNYCNQTGQYPLTLFVSNLHSQSGIVFLPAVDDAMTQEIIDEMKKTLAHRPSIVLKRKMK